MKRFLLLAYSFIWALTAYASVGLEQIQQLVTEYDQTNLPYLLDHDPNCTGPEACMKKACDNMSRHECDDQDELFKLARACKGNCGSGCYQVFVSKLNSFEYDSLEEAVVIAQGCRGNYGGGCINYICSQLNTFDCDERKELLTIAKECGN